MRSHILVLLLAASLDMALGVRNFDLRWTYSNCTDIDPVHLSMLECPIRELGKQRGNVLNVSLRFIRNVPKMMITFRITLPSGGNQELEFVKLKTKSCDLFDAHSKNAILNALLKEIFKNGNMPRKCPIKTNFTYYMNNFSLNPDYFPPYTPDVEFTTYVNMQTEKGGNVASMVVKIKVAKKLRKP